MSLNAFYKIVARPKILESLYILRIQERSYFLDSTFVSEAAALRVRCSSKQNS